MNIDDFLPAMRDVVRCETSLRELNLMWRLIEMNAKMNGDAPSRRLVPMMAATRTGFEHLQGEVIRNLVEQKLAGATSTLRTKAQHIIDILVRNLFERTADVGFLATDRRIAEFLAGQHDRAAIEARLRAYREKYTVYDDIVVLDAQGAVRARLAGDVDERRHADAWFAEAMDRSGYVEAFGPSSLCPDRPAILAYLHRITHPVTHQPIGVLCLVFAFDTEMAAIFAPRQSTEQPSVSLILDGQGRVIVSSDEDWIPSGRHLPAPAADGLTWFGDGAYLAQRATATGFQGYPGPPGWEARVMTPVDVAFRPVADAASGARPVDAELAAGLLAHADVLCPPLQQIMEAARDIRRVVWNGQVMTIDDGVDSTRSKAVLEQITETGARSDAVFERSTDDLFDTVLRASCADAEALSRLLVDLLDRNLYERANDCRWWAMTPEFRTALSRPDPTPIDVAAIGPILTRINALYTVYTRLMVYDRQGRILAASHPLKADGGTVVGESIDAETWRGVRALRSPQDYHVEPFGPSAWADGAATYVYHAAIRHVDRDGEVVGGVAIVFDAARQLSAMLGDCLGDALRGPRGDAAPTATGHALFVDRQGRVLASSDDAYHVGGVFPLAAARRAVPNGGSHAGIEIIDGRYLTLAVAASPGYREFKTRDGYRDDVLAVTLRDLGAVGDRARHRQVTVRDLADVDQAPAFATFHTQTGLLALPSTQVIEAIAGGQIRPVSYGASTYRVGTVARRREAAVQDYVWVYDLNAIMGGAPRGTWQDAEVLVLMHAGVQIGLLVDGLHSVPRFDPDQIVPARLLSRDGGAALVSHLIRANGGELMIQVLDPSRLLATLGLLPAPADSEAGDEAARPVT